jgi:hypothetical protein
MANLFDEEDDLPSSLDPEQKKLVYGSVYDKFQKAQQDAAKATQTATDSADRDRLVTRFAEAFENFGRAKAQARGGAKTDSGFYDSLRSGVDKREQAAKQAAAQGVESTLLGAKLQRQDQDNQFTDLQRDREKKTWADADEVTGREKDPASQESQMAQALAKKLMPSRDFSGLSAFQLKSSLPMVEKLYQLEQQALERQRLEEDRRISRGIAAGARADARAEREQIRADAKAEKEALRGEQRVEDVGKALGSEVAVTKNNLKQIQSIVANSGDDIPGVGPLDSLAPDFLTSNDGVNLRQASRTLVGNLIKLRSGTAASDAEVERIMGELGMGRGASEEAFKSGLQKLQADTVEALKAKEAGFDPKAVQTYQQRGGVTSKDFTLPLGSISGKDEKKTVTRKQYSPSRNKTKLIYSDGTEEVVDGKR